MEQRSLHPTLIISNVLLDDQPVHILVEGSTIAQILPATASLPATSSTCRHIDGHHKAAFPGLINTHTHAAMTLFRGYGDDLPLQQWLEEKIWPNEQHLDDDIVYWGTRLACLEMIKGGTTTFNDMYFHLSATAQAVADSGMKAALTQVAMDFFDPSRTAEAKQQFADYERLMASNQWPQVQWDCACHSVYTVSTELLQWVRDFAREHHTQLSIHASETQKECNDCQLRYGRSPIQLLDSLDMLDEHLIVAHGLWLSDDDVRLLGAHRCTVVHNPNSNLKLGSGARFLYSELRQAGANIALGTDGCSSSNNLDMIEACKTMSLLQKGWRADPPVLPAAEVLSTASAGGATALGWNTGRLEPGMQADLFLTDLDNLAFVPNNNSLSNLIYAAHADCVDTTIRGGQVVMEHRKVKDEALIVAEARRAARKLITV